MKKSGFTLVELSVSVLIISIISIVLIMVFRSNLNTVKFGQKHMDFNQKVLLAMRRIFYDLKSINPVLYKSETYGYAIKDEKSGEPKPKMIFIKKFASPDKNDELEFALDNGKDVEETYNVLYTINNNNLIKRTRNLKLEEKEEIVLENVSLFRVENDSQDVKQIYIRFIADDKKTGLKRDVDFAVRLESDFVYVDKQDNQ